MKSPVDLFLILYTGRAQSFLCLIIMMAYPCSSLFISCPFIILSNFYCFFKNNISGCPWHSAFQQQPPIDDITIVDDRRGHEDDIQIVDDRGGRGGRDGGRGGDSGRDGGGRGGRGSRSPRGDRKRSRSHRSRSRSRDRSSRSRRRSRSR